MLGIYRTYHRRSFKSRLYFCLFRMLELADALVMFLSFGCLITSWNCDKLSTYLLSKVRGKNEEKREERDLAF